MINFTLFAESLLIPLLGLCLFVFTKEQKKFKSEIESYNDPEDENKRDTIQARDVLMLDRISI